MLINMDNNSMFPKRTNIKNGKTTVVSVGIDTHTHTLSSSLGTSSSLSFHYSNVIEYSRVARFRGERDFDRIFSFQGAGTRAELV